MTDPNLSLRPATPDDAAAMLEIYGPFVQGTPTTFEIDVPSVEAFRKRIETISSRNPWLAAIDGGQVVGYAYASEHRARIAYQWVVEVSVYVRDGYRRSGVGRMLYTRLFELLKGQGYFTALAGITVPNTSSIGFHESFGFKPIGVYRSIGYKLGEWHDVGWWQLELAAPCTNPSPPRRNAPPF